MKNRWEFYQFIDELLENYKGNDYVKEGTSINNRINGFINEFGIEMSEYGGDRTGIIYLYFINSIIELVEEVK
jgi:hypothetical protein